MKDRFFGAQEAFEYWYEHITRNLPGHRGNFAKTKAIFNISFAIINPLENLVETSWRNWKKDYADLEYKWYLSGDRNPAEVEAAAKIWTGMKDEFGFVNSNYGFWWKRNNQLQHCIDLLKSDPDTRRAIIVHYSPDEIQTYGKDTPCNVVLNFFIVGGELNMTIFARSIDLVFGFCNDQYCFSRLQFDMANELGIPVGTSHYFITNLHIYEKHWYIRK